MRATRALRGAMVVRASRPHAMNGPEARSTGLQAVVKRPLAATLAALLNCEPYRLMVCKPRHLDIKRDRGLTVEWEDGSTSFYSVAYLRKWSPSAEARTLREQLAKNPLTVLPASAVSGGAPLTIVDAEFVGNYAVKIRFSDGHDTGLYSWEYLQEIDPARHAPPASESPQPRERHG